ncbi:methyl-accepting chemotaxis protein, partial [Vibrio echinoideorum]
SFQSSSGLLQNLTYHYFELAYRIAQGMIDEEIRLSEAGGLAKQSTAILDQLTLGMHEFCLARESELESAVQDLQSKNKKANQIMS